MTTQALNPTSSGLDAQILAIESDPAFTAIQKIAADCDSRVNFFRIVGRTHTETWHSAFWAWLLDPCGSHGLSSLPLRLLLELLADHGRTNVPPESTVQPPFVRPEQLHTLATQKALEHLITQPSEKIRDEKRLSDDCRLDIWLELPESISIETPDLSGRRLRIVIELKVDASPDGDQLNRYAERLLEKYPHHDKEAFLCIFIGRVSRNLTLPDRVGDSWLDPRWFQTDYQQLYDRLLQPIHTELANKPQSTDVAHLVSQYILNLASGKGKPMAITDHERQLARAFLNNHRDTLSLLCDITSKPGVAPSSGSEEEEKNINLARKVRNSLRDIGDEAPPSDRKNTERRRLLKSFWDGLQKRADERNFTLHTKSNTDLGHQFDKNFDKIHYTYRLGEESGYIQLTVKRSDVPAQELVSLIKDGKQIPDEIAGLGLQWIKNDDKGFPVFRTDILVGAGFRSPQEQWPAVQDALIDAMERIHRFVQKYPAPAGA
jgi:hypothetical protein